MKPSTTRSPSMGFDEDNFPSFKFFVILMFLGIGLALLFHAAVRKWFRETFRKCFSRISPCLRFGSDEEANERGADAALQEALELRDLVNEDAGIHPQQNRDHLRAHRGRGRPQLPYELRDLQNNLIEFRPDGHLRYPRLLELPIGLRDLNQNNLINLHPDGCIRREQGGYGPELNAEMRNLRNNLDNLPNGDIRRNQEHSL